MQKESGQFLIGALSAAFLVYLVVGSIVGSVIAVEPTDAQRQADVHLCWPTATFYSIYVQCDDAVAQQLWFWTIVLPNVLLEGPVRALVKLTSSYNDIHAFEAQMIAIRTAFVAAPVVTCFMILRRRAQSLAWLLLLALIGEIIYLRLLIPDALGG